MKTHKDIRTFKSYSEESLIRAAQHFGYKFAHFCVLLAQGQLNSGELEYLNKLDGKLAMPEMLEHPNYGRITEMVEQYVEFLTGDNYHSDNNWEHWFYEVCLDTHFGPEIWEYINQKDK